MANTRAATYRRISLFWKIFFMAFGLVGLSIILITMASTLLSERIMREASLNALTSIGQTKKLHVENIFETFRKQAVTFSNNQMITEATRNFRDVFTEFQRDNHIKASQLQQMKQAVQAFYEGPFSEAFKDQNHGNAPQGLNRIFQSLDDDSVAYQHAFIVNNEFPLGEKDQLVKGKEDFSAYTQFHETYHPKIRQFAREFGFRDIFLVDSETGRIVYSVSKGIEFTTSLNDGPFANTNLGRLFQTVNAQDNENFVRLIDFDPYFPAYDTAAGFIGSPVYDWGEKIGVMIFQLPIDEINDVMTSHSQWKEIGLGETGETYLIGQDLVIRNNSRFLFDESGSIAPNYLEALEEQGLDETQVQAILDKRTSILNQRIDTEGSRAVTSGESGSGEYEGYLGETVVGAFRPLNIQDVTWGIVAEIQQQEISAQINKVRFGILGSAIVVLLIAMVVTLIFTQSFTGRIQRNLRDLNEIATTKDLSKQIQIESNDEISDMAAGFNNFIGELRITVKHIDQNSLHLASASTELSSTVDDINQTTEEIAGNVDHESAAVTETTKNVQHLANSIQETSDRVKVIQNIANESQENAVQCSEAIEQTNISMSKIDDSSKEIVGIINVITEIANQTNLLSLNAAIEAAKAGESGKGFAVVADEVRRLAERSSTSVIEIQRIIEISTKQVEEGKEIIGKTGTVLDQIVTKVNEISNLVNEISGSAADQSEGIQLVAQAAQDLAKESEENALATGRLSGALGEISKTSEHLSQMADQLEHQISQFNT